MICLLWLLSPVFALSKGQVNDIVKSINQLIPATNESKGDFFGGVVRLAFHDAGTWDAYSRTSGPDGCMNFSDSSNFGLQEIADQLAPTYEQYSSIISRADFWVLAANTIIVAAEGPDIPFRYGRKDCTSLPTTDQGRLPSAELSYSHVMDVFQTRMGFTPREISALMGAHSLGKCEPQNSGYMFAWDTTPHILDNLFYKQVKALQWTRITQELNATFGVTHQWVPGNALMMLNTDMALFYGNVGEGNTGVCTTTAPTTTQCTNNPTTGPYVFSYADDQSLFHTDFARAFQKMSELGWEGQLQEPTKGSGISKNDQIGIAIIANVILWVLVGAAACYYNSRSKSTKDREGILLASSSSDSSASS